MATHGAMLSHHLRFGDVSLDVGDDRLDREAAGGDFFHLLKAFIGDTYACCSLHRRRMQRAVFAPESFRSFADMARIPMMSSPTAVAEMGLMPDRYRDAMIHGFDQLPAEDRMAKKFTTSGSTGRPKISFYTASDWEATLAATARVLYHVPPADRCRIFHCFNNGHTAGKVYEDAFSRLGCAVENRHFSLSSEEAVMQQMRRGLREVGGFNTLSVPPYTPEGAVQKGITLDGLLEVDLDNYLGEKVRTVITAANWRDNPRYDLRRRMWDANDAAGAPHTQFVDTFGCSEVGTLAYECEAMDGLHLLLGATYTEVVRPDGTHVEDGERGRILVTGLKHGSRYLRYIVGDEATFVSTPCACGRATPRLKHIVRVLDKERLRQGCAAG